MDFSGTFSKAKKELGLGGSGFFSIKDGESKKIRIVSDAVRYESISTFGGEEKPRVQFLAYVIDREDGKIKPYLMPASVMGFVSQLQDSEEYGFPKDSDIPYDITVSRNKEGGRTVYAVVASRKNSNLTEVEQQEIAGLKPLEQIIERLKAKQQKPQDHEIEIDEEDMPD